MQIQIKYVKGPAVLAEDRVLLPRHFGLLALLAARSPSAEPGSDRVAVKGLKLITMRGNPMVYCSGPFKDPKMEPASGSVIYTIGILESRIGGSIIP